MRNQKRRNAGVGLAAMLAAGLVTGLVTATHGPAQAASSTSSPNVIVHGTGVETVADAREIRRFWTPRRMRKAVPLSLERSATAPAGTRAGTSTSSTSREATKGKQDKKVKGRAWKRGGEVVTTTGVLFFILKGNFYTCSASLVDAPNESTVVTAGHCLHSGEGDEEENVASFVEFVPGVPDGRGGGTFTAPADAWVATRIAVTQEWATDADTDYDVGMIEVQQHQEETLQDAVGAAPGIRFFDGVPKHPAPVHAFGYPTNKPYSGVELAYCAGTPRAVLRRDTQALRLACNMAEGSSGGPWLQGFGGRHNDGLGRMVAVTSFGYTDDKKGVYGPYFGDEARAVYRSVQRSEAS